MLLIFSWHEDNSKCFLICFSVVGFKLEDVAHLCGYGSSSVQRDNIVLEALDNEIYSVQKKGSVSLFYHIAKHLARLEYLSPHVVQCEMPILLQM